MDPTLSTDIDKFTLRVRCKVIATQPKLGWALSNFTHFTFNEEAGTFAEHLNSACLRIWLWNEIFKRLGQQT